MDTFLSFLSPVGFPKRLAMLRNNRRHTLQQMAEKLCALVSELKRCDSGGSSSVAAHEPTPAKSDARRTKATTR